MKANIVKTNLLVSLITLSSAVFAEQGMTLNITGNVTDAGSECTLSLPATIDLGTNDVTSLAKSSAATTNLGAKVFNINMSNCAHPENYNVHFLGQSDSHDPSVLANATGTDYAQGVGVALYHMVSGTLGKIDITKNQNLNQNLSDNYALAMVTIEGVTPAAGKISSSLNLQIDTL